MHNSVQSLDNPRVILAAPTGAGKQHSPFLYIHDPTALQKQKYVFISNTERVNRVGLNYLTVTVS